MKAIKQLLRPERLRQVPEQFSWVDQALVQQHFIDRCEARSAALYLFLVTVSDAQGLSYYGSATLARRLHLSDEQFAAARQQLIELDLIAYRSPLYQVLALPGTVAAQRPAPRPPGVAGANTGGQPVSLAALLQQARARRG
ncbi:MAG: hypothetical protein KA711_14955 [Ideonella sp. WA131b]|nr:hypothetical protein [Ideonella sp. WA131b]MCM0608529.1 hypothetical protein [Ideonella sp. WA131b]MCM0608599.1 hypothetical protein [Ideonella sp. WA131b]MCM0609011.1 hypothetical protein [Ideonella sp. WA131b]MCM0609516.1 hypothetical protein [Ideonella sp. WA131b]